MRIVFVCLGNICRSPMAEGVMTSLVRRSGRDGEIRVASAGTGGWHAGEPPDPRAVAAARRRGIELDGVARQFAREDFARYDLIVALDGSVMRDLVAMAPDEAAAARVRLLREFDPASAAAGSLDVPDPYYGGPRSFDTTLELVFEGCRGLLAQIPAAESA